jgi:hypothetical protein
MPDETPPPVDSTFLKSLQLYNNFIKSNADVATYFKEVHATIKKFDLLCRFYTIYDTPRKNFISLALKAINYDGLGAPLNPDTIKKLCNTIEMYRKYLEIEYDCCLAVYKIGSFKLPVEAEKRLFPHYIQLVLSIESHFKTDFGTLLKVEEYCNKNSLNLHSTLSETQQHITAYNFQQHYNNNQKVRDFCDEIIATNRCISNLARWLKRFYGDINQQIFQSETQHKTVIVYAQLMNGLLDNLERLNKSIIAFANRHHSDLSYREDFLKKIHQLIKCSIGSEQNKGEEIYDKAQEILSKIRVWIELIDNDASETLYKMNPSSDENCYEPEFFSQKRKNHTMEPVHQGKKISGLRPPFN